MAIVDHPAVFMGSLVVAPHCIKAEMRQVMSQLIQVLLAEGLRLLGAWSASHAGILARAKKQRSW